MKHLTGILLASGLLVLAGCASSDVHEFVPKWDKWIGSTKDDRIRELGIPNKCHTFRDGGEVCEWSVQQIDGRYETIGLTFDPKGKACEWSYRGFYGQQTSKAKCQAT